MPKTVPAPTFAVALVFIYGFILWTVYISMTGSSFLPSYDFIGLANYIKLWEINRWWVAARSLFILGGRFIIFCTVCFATGETQPITVALNNLVNTSRGEGIQCGHGRSHHRRSAHGVRRFRRGKILR